MHLKSGRVEIHLRSAGQSKRRLFSALLPAWSVPPNRTGRELKLTLEPAIDSDVQQTGAANPRTNTPPHVHTRASGVTAISQATGLYH
uniref:Uncharacterized protein n=1 Tax=Theileria annulata TaxID=5874 RepID=A0A3B0NBR2_THEAN